MNYSTASDRELVAALPESMGAIVARHRQALVHCIGVRVAHAKAAECIADACFAEVSFKSFDPTRHALLSWLLWHAGERSAHWETPIQKLHAEICTQLGDANCLSLEEVESSLPLTLEPSTMFTLIDQLAADPAIDPAKLREAGQYAKLFADEIWECEGGSFQRRARYVPDVPTPVDRLFFAIERAADRGQDVILWQVAERLAA